MRRDPGASPAATVSGRQRLWRNWYTRRLQVPVGATPWRFESSQPHCARSPSARPTDTASARGTCRKARIIDTAASTRTGANAVTIEGFFALAWFSWGQERPPAWEPIVLDIGAIL